MEKPKNMATKNQTPPISDGKTFEIYKDLGRKLIKKIGLRNILIGVALIVAFSLIFTTYKINEINTRAFLVYFGDEEVGIIREQEEAIGILGEIKEGLCNTYGIDVVLLKDISFEDTHAKDEQIVTSNELKSNIKSKITFLVNSYALSVDGKDLGFAKTQEDIEKVLDELKEIYVAEVDDNSQLEDIGFVEDIKIQNKEIPLNRIDDMEELIQLIQTGGEEIKTHLVEVGESLWTIAKIYDMSVDDLIEANSDKTPEKLQIGDEIKLLVPKSLITVKTVEKAYYTEKTDYDIEVEYDKQMYKTEKTIKVKGKKGESEYVARITRHDGRIAEKEVLDEKIIEEPVNELVVQGTKELPKTVATGLFLTPIQGRVSSRYGMRNGRMHRGLDIAAKVGTSIKAADGGKVTYAGWKGTYGNLVEINHGNGYITRYAHCSSINVKKGDKVFKGQVIAKVGNTGRSTGPHLHFEVLRNGSNQNPANYIK